MICPDSNLFYTKEDYLKHHNGKAVPFGFNYNSGENDSWLTVDQLRDQIVNHVDPEFKILTT